jgi:hypothetical protein
MKWQELKPKKKLLVLNLEEIEMALNFKGIIHQDKVQKVLIDEWLDGIKQGMIGLQTGNPDLYYFRISSQSIRRYDINLHRPEQEKGIRETFKYFEDAFCTGRRLFLTDIENVRDSAFHSYYKELGITDKMLDNIKNVFKHQTLISKDEFNENLV